MLNLPSPVHCRPRFHRDGYVLVQNALEAGMARSLARTAERVRREAGVSIDRRTAGAGLAYSVVTGDRIQSEARDLFDLYTSPALL